MGKIAKAGGGLLKGSALAATAYGAYDIYSTANDKEKSGTEKIADVSKTVAGLGGAWAGTKGGALIGGAIGSAIPVVGTVVGATLGGIIGGIGGYFAGDYFGNAISDTIKGETVGNITDSFGISPTDQASPLALANQQFSLTALTATPDSVSQYLQPIKTDSRTQQDNRQFNFYMQPLPANDGRKMVQQATQEVGRTNLFPTFSSSALYDEPE